MLLCGSVNVIVCYLLEIIIAALAAAPTHNNGKQRASEVRNTGKGKFPLGLPIKGLRRKDEAMNTSTSLSTKAGTTQKIRSYYAPDHSMIFLFVILFSVWSLLAWAGFLFCFRRLRLLQALQLRKH